MGDLNIKKMPQKYIQVPMDEKHCARHDSLTWVCPFGANGVGVGPKLTLSPKSREAHHNKSFDHPFDQMNPKPTTPKHTTPDQLCQFNMHMKWDTYCASLIFGSLQ